MGGASKTGLLFITFQIIYLISAQEVVKRVPQGFVGMRGKKYFGTHSAEVERFFKRKPQFFVGVKGKKSLDEILEPDTYIKRAPMGFVGMRGKKDLTQDSYYTEAYNNPMRPAGSLIGQIDYSTEDEQRGATSNMLTDYINKVIRLNSLETEMKSMPQMVDESSAELTNEVEKRAASIHQFFGVRGKKAVQNKRPYDLTFRGKFIGVRGKKDMKNDELHDLKVLLEQTAPWPKRKTQMGFFGMRGKKWDEESESVFNSGSPN